MTALTLVSATYTTGIGSAVLTLTFDRAVNIDAYDGSQVSVNDGTFNMHGYNGTGGVALHAPERVDITLAELGEVITGPVTMNASDLTGIVAVDDGGTWEGASDLPLPWMA